MCVCVLFAYFKRSEFQGRCFTTGVCVSDCVCVSVCVCVLFILVSKEVNFKAGVLVQV